MYLVLYLSSLTGFFLLAPGALLARYKCKPKMPWWLVFLAIGAGSWFLVNATVFLYYKHLHALMVSHSNPPEELIARWSGDGAKRVFALLFGWLYGLVYSVPFLVLYGVASYLRGKKRVGEND